MNEKKSEIEKIKGLSSEEVEEKIREGKVNYDTTEKTQSIKSIIISNFFTLFNIMNFVLAILIILVGAYKNLLFIIIVLINTLISTIQEIISKKTIDKLSLLAKNKVCVIRNGKEEKIDSTKIVLEDIIKLSSGDQIPADSVVIQGEIFADESVLTGEPDNIFKKTGDKLLSGSYVVSGICLARLEHVGRENYISQISAEAKKKRKINSEIMISLNKIIKFISYLILPIGILFFINQYGITHDFKVSIVNMVAALIGMIPEGLVLLTSTVLAVSVGRLARKKVLVQELFCIETLARVDVLCLDKTGTITEGKMKVDDVKIYNDEILPKSFFQMMKAYVNEIPDSNATFEALKNYFDGPKPEEDEEKGNKAKDNKLKYNKLKGNKLKDDKPKDELKSDELKKDNNFEIISNIPFSSERKWSAVNFKEYGSIIVGAPEILIEKAKIKMPKEIEEGQKAGKRMLLVCYSKDIIDNEKAENEAQSNKITVVASIMLSDVIRKNSKEILQYFEEQGVDIKIISGDSPISVSNIAKRAGVKNYNKYIDTRTLKTDEEIIDAAREYSIFGRVTPKMKKQIILALKNLGHTVAMTGDGVNDVLALKNADCSISVASGTEAARNVSQIVLMDSNFASMPAIVAEGRRTINNIMRSASLFLVKTIYASILAIIFIFVKFEYPFIPIQLTLINLVTIGIPSVILALEPNYKKIEGRFLEAIIRRALPTSLTVVTNIIIIAIISEIYNLSVVNYSSVCVVVTALTCFILLFKICRPFNWRRVILFIGVISVFCVGLFIFKDLFSISLNMENIIPISLIIVISILIGVIYNKIAEGIINLVEEFRKRKLIKKRMKIENKK